MKKALKAFVATYGLEASQGKTPIYFGDVGGEIQERILQDTGFYKGEFPFKDLGVGMAMGPGDYAYLMQLGLERNMHSQGILKATYNTRNQWLNDSKLYTVKGGYRRLKGQVE